MAVDFLCGIERGTRDTVTAHDNDEFVRRTTVKIKACEKIKNKKKRQTFSARTKRTLLSQGECRIVGYIRNSRGDGYNVCARWSVVCTVQPAVGWKDGRMGDAVIAGRPANGKLRCPGSRTRTENWEQRSKNTKRNIVSNSERNPATRSRCCCRCCLSSFYDVTAMARL